MSTIKALTVICLIFPSWAALGQSLVFHENFDLPSGPDSVTTAGGSPWITSSQLWVSPSQSFWVQGSSSSSSDYFETQPFSTVGKPYVTLEFSHIAKISVSSGASVQISVDSGQSWTNLTADQYLGNDGTFISMGYFNHSSHLHVQNGQIISPWKHQQAQAIPDNTWWRKELFDLTGMASDTSGGTGNFTGYPDVRLRFAATFWSPPFSAGWFVDNLNVTASNCENMPPQLSFDFQPSPCYNPRPTSYIPADTSNSYPVGVLATDTFAFDSGIDSVSIYYQINGGGFTGAKMPHISGDEYRVDLNNIYPGDSVDYYIEAYDLGCPNTGRSPASGWHSFIVDDGSLSKCGSVGCNQSQAVIHNFPWKEDFEDSHWVPGSGTGNSGTSHRGSFPPAVEGWGLTPQTTTSYGWSIRTGNTGTNATGPESDHTTGTGKYLYSEFSPPPSSTHAITTLTTPCIDLRDSVPRMLSFFYHMFGSDVSLLRIDVDTGSSSTSFWINYYQINGEQQLSSLDPWQKAQVSLIPLTGKIVKLRFLTHRPPGNGDKNDIAIDDLQITNADAVDGKLIAHESDLESPCGASSNVNIGVGIQNLGADSLQSIPIAYQLDSAPVVYDTVSNADLGLADSLSFSFSQLLSFSPSSSHMLKVWIDLPGDVDQKNDSLTFNIPQKSSYGINQFPHFIDFEDASVNALFPGNLNDSSWTLNAINTNAYWSVASGLLNRSVEGPIEGLGRDRKLILLRNLSGSPTEAELRSSCVDLSNITNPQLNFNLYLKSGVDLILRVRELGKSWVVHSVITGTGTEKSEMLLQKFPLSQYAGKTIELSLYVNDPAANLDQQIAIDNIQIMEENNLDLGLYHVSGELKRMPAGSSSLPGFNIGYGLAGVPASGGYTSKLVVEYKDLCNINAPVYKAEHNFNTSSVASTNRSRSISSLNLNDSIPAGKYQVSVWLETVGDSLHFNDSVRFESVVFPVQNIPYFNDFEACQQELLGRGLLRQWERSQPSGGAHSGSYAFETNSRGPLRTGANPEYLLLPFFEGMDTVYGAELRFWHNFDLPGSPSYNYGKVEYFDAGSWENLTQNSIDGQNWKQYMTSGFNGDVFNGSSGGWIHSGYPLDHTILNSGRSVLRFTTKSDNSSNSNWLIDDLEIYVPPQHSASPEEILFSHGVPKNGNNNISVSIENTGRAPLSEAEVTILDMSGNTLLNESVTFSTPLLWQQAVQVPLQNPVNLSPNTTQVMVITSRPNKRSDHIPTDDTLIFSLLILPTITDMPYCVDFESGSEFLSFDPDQGRLGSLWNHGNPNKSLILGSHSGQSSWATDLQDEYPRLSDNYLFLPPMAVKGQTCYKLSFWHWYESEFNFDGGNVEYSLDSGQTWAVLGRHGDTSWYNTPYVQSLSGVHPGFSGSSSGWVEAWKEFQVFATGSIQFRFRFASNASVHSDGWAIDDICMEEVSGSCHQIALDERALLPGGLNIYPNPTNDALNLVFSPDLASAGGIAELSILDHSGKLIRKWQQETTTGVSHQIDISNLPAGVYLLKTEISGSFSTKQFVKI